MYSPKADAIAHGELPCDLKGPQSCVVKSFAIPWIYFSLLLKHTAFVRPRM